MPYVSLYVGPLSEALQQQGHNEYSNADEHSD